MEQEKELVVDCDEPEIRYCDVSLLTRSSARNIAYLIPAEESDSGLVETFVWSNIGSGMPSQAYHDRWWRICDVPKSAVPEEVNAVLKRHELSLLAIARSYGGTKWNGNNHVGQWSLELEAMDTVRQFIERDMDNVAQYWTADEWFSQSDISQIVDGRPLEQIVDETINKGLREDAHLEDLDVRTYILDTARNWLIDNDDPEIDDTDDATLRERLIKLTT